MFDLANLSVFFFAYVFAVFAFLKIVFVNFGPSSQTPGDDIRNSISTLFLWLTTALIPLIANTINNVYTFVRTNWFWFALSGGLLLTSFALYENQPVVDKINDAYEITIVLPILNDVVLPVLNFLRVAFDAVICWTNALGSVGRIIRNQFLDITFDCDVAWVVIPQLLGKLAISAVNATNNFIIVDKFDKDYRLAPVIEYTADVISELNPLFDCQCRDFNFIWPTLINPDYGIIQSKHMALYPEVVLNFAIDTTRQVVNMGVDVGERILIGCNPGNETPTEIRDCEVGRAPKLQHWSDLSCQFFTHQTDFVDDVFFSIDSMLRDKFSINIPWTRPPRVLSIFAMFPCLLSDTFSIGIDILTHLDLFFTLDSNSGRGNYAAELDLDLFMSRLYNVSTLIENAGTDISGTFAENSFCLLARSLRILFGILDFALQIFRRLCARNFSSAAVSSLMGQPEIATVINNLEADAAAVEFCANNLGNELGEAGKLFIAGLAKLSAPLVRFAKGITENPDAILTYFSSIGFQTDIDDSFTGLNIIAAAAGGAIRQYGAFGDVYCSARNVLAAPNSLVSIEMGSMHLNLLCAVGTFVEMSIRVPVSILEQLFDIIAAIARLAGTSMSTFDIEDFAVLFEEEGVLDIGRLNGVVENQCLWVDSAALFVPSLLTISPISNAVCPFGSGTVPERLYDLFRSLGRQLVMAPFMTVRAVLRFMSALICLDGDCIDFPSWCDNFIKPIWRAIVIPPIQTFISVLEMANCVLDTDGIFGPLIEAFGKAFIDEDFGEDGLAVVPCSEFVGKSDGGLILNVLCDFLSTLSDIIDIIVNIFSKGFWQAIWEMISGPLFAVIEGISEWLECLWGQVVNLFNKLGECGEALVDIGQIFSNLDDYVERVDDDCGDWDGVFGQCVFTLEIEQYNINSPLPNGGGIIGNPNPVTIVVPQSALYGSCIKSNGFCAQRTDFAPGFITKDFESNDCATDGFGANAFVPGLTCPEINITASLQGIGACCIPNEDCIQTTYSACNATISGLGQKAVWAKDRTCSSLGDECFVSSNSQLGCCITPDGIGLLDTNLRHPVAGRNAEECYGNGATITLIRPYYIPTDSTCAQIQAHPIYQFLLNSTDVFLDNIATSPFFNSSTLERRFCTPEDDIHLTDASKLYDTSCVVQRFTDNSNIFPDQPIFEEVFGTPNAVPIRISGTGYLPTDGFATYWTCRSRVDWIRGNTYTGTVTFPNICTFPLCPILGSDPDDDRNLVEDSVENAGFYVLGWQNTIVTFFDGFTQTTPFADPALLDSYPAAFREERMEEDFEIECRWVYAELVNTDDLEVTFGAFTSNVGADSNFFKGDCAAEAVLDLGNAICVTSDCRFRRNNGNAFFPVPKEDPYFDQGYPFFPFVEAGDGVSSRGNSLALVYFLNGSIDLSRDVTGALCNTFIPEPALAPILIAPDEFIAPMASRLRRVEVASDTEAEVTSETSRRTLSLVLSHEGIQNESHPCYEIYDLMQLDNSSRQINFLLKERMDSCLLSNAAAHALDSLLMHNSRVAGYRLTHPHFTYKSAVGWSTLFNVTRGIAMALSYNGYLLTEYVYAKDNTTMPANMTSGYSSWPEYAAANRVTDPLSLRIGSFFTLFTQISLAHDHQGVPQPRGLGFIGSLISMAKFAVRTSGNSTMTLATRYTNGTDNMPPLFSEYGWSAINNFVTLNWMSGNGSSNYTEAALRIQKIKSLSTYTSAVAQTGLIQRGLSTEQAINFDELCDPRDRSCIDCELVVGSVETFVEVLLNCVEDMQDDRRFQLDIDRVILARTNTFIQANDTLKCKNPPLMEGDTNFLLDFLLDVTDMIVDRTSYNFTDFVETRTAIDPKWSDIGFARYWTKRIQCYATNFDEEDPHSIVMHLKKLRSCDPVTDNSAGRGRAGLPLRTAFLWVTGGAIVLFLAASLCLPSVAFNWVTLIVYIHLILWATYWWSPSCAVPLPPVPIPTYPDGLMDDLYVELRELIPRNCAEYHEDVASGPCSIEGRTFVDCSDYGFDFGGARHLAYALAYLDPATPSAIRDTSVPFLSSLMETPYFSEAFTGIEDIHQTPIGDYCFGFPSLSPRKFVPLLGAVLMATLLAGLALSFLSLILGGLITLFLSLSVVKSLISAFGNFITRSKVRTNRYRVSSA
jgi:hypothetical protein